jgi:hypothetical protein
MLSQYLGKRNNKVPACFAGNGENLECGDLSPLLGFAKNESADKSAHSKPRKPVIQICGVVC